MPELKPGEAPETFEERCEAVAKTLADLAKWCHCNHDADDLDGRNPDAGGVWSFNEEVASAIHRDRAPEWVGPNTFGDYDTYGWQIFVKTASEAILHDREWVELALEAETQKLENGVGKPSATDGSKGQWRASKTSQIRTYEWLLEGNDD